MYSIDNKYKLLNLMAVMHQRGNSVKTHQRPVFPCDASASKMGYHAGMWEPKNH
ncbi:hypothetical protein QUF74_19540 [Candidatus Halobeggiatoa sp. HSG11]|nr:hypothetical protein [Candidatus Halobeggiatoa sp. HSG11]